MQFSLDVDLVAGVAMFGAIVIYIIRMEGKVGLVTEIVKRIERDSMRRLDLLENKDRFDGYYPKRERGNPADE